MIDDNFPEIVGVAPNNYTTKKICRRPARRKMGCNPDDGFLLLMKLIGNGYVYLMIDRANGRWKIGWSKNPQYRENTLQSEKPDIKLVDYFWAAREMEKAFHLKWAHRRIRGEWFALRRHEVGIIRRNFDVLRGLYQ